MSEVDLDKLPWALIDLSIQFKTDAEMENFLNGLSDLCAKHSYDGCDWNYNLREKHYCELENKCKNTKSP